MPEIGYKEIAIVMQNADHIAFSKWLVQLVVNKKWYTAYFDTPPAGKPEVLYNTRMEAFEACVLAALKDL